MDLMEDDVTADYPELRVMQRPELVTTRRPAAATAVESSSTGQ